MKTSQLMLYREKNGFCFSESLIKHINTMCGQHTEFLNVKSGGRCNNQRSVKSSKGDAVCSVCS